MKSAIALLSIFAATSALASTTSSLPSGKLSCNEVPRADNQSFTEMTASFSGKSVSIKAKLSESTIQSIENNTASFQKVLDGTAIGGGAPTDEDKAQARKAIDADNAILKAGKSGLSLKGTLQPYVHAKGDMIRYTLEVTSPGVDSATLWDLIGNEGMSGILRLDPSDLKNSVEIYTAGGQGGTYDGFECSQD